MMHAEPRYLNLYFQVHQPRRIRKFSFFDIGSGRPYFDDRLNKEIVCRVARKCYLPANKLLLRLIEKYPGLKITFSISGTAIEQFEQYAPEVLRSFRMLAETGAVEFLGETYYHSLSYFISDEEFIAQVGMHKQVLDEHFGIMPAFFRHTELIYSDGIGAMASGMGFSGMYVDGVESILRGRTPNSVYLHPEKDFILIPRNYRLSDDIAFRFSDQTWTEWPLTGKKFVSWLSMIPGDQRMISLAMDYETFGEHKHSDSGIFDFLEDVITPVTHQTNFIFINPSEMRTALTPAGVISSEQAISWADESRDLSAWLGNDMQRDAFESLYRLRDAVVYEGDDSLVRAYRHLQTSDHFYYMATKGGPDGSVHQYFSPYDSPYEAFMNFMNIVADIEFRMKRSRELVVESAAVHRRPVSGTILRR